MSERIEVGTRVRVDFAFPDHPNEQPYFFGTLLARPRDTGDTFSFRMEDSGRITEVNPNGPTFESITEAPDE